MDYEPTDLKDMPCPAAAVHQLASPRTVKAVIVYTLLVLVAVMVLQGIPIEDTIKSILLLVLGSFFEPVLKPQAAPTSEKA